MSLLLVAVLLITAEISAGDKIRKTFDTSVFRSLTDCIKSGPACDHTCQHVGICIDSGNGYAWRGTQTCNSGELCDTDTHRCVAQDNSKCVPNSETIGCEVGGTFPDPYDCTRSLSCTAQGTASPGKQCDAGLIYDSCTGECDTDSSRADNCTQVAPLCQYAGQVKRIPENHRIYYYCAEDNEKRLHPVISRCAEGFFDVETESCSKSTVAGCVDPNGGSNE